VEPHVPVSYRGTKYSIIEVVKHLVSNTLMSFRSGVTGLADGRRK
jgi:hypothetical protein